MNQTNKKKLEIWVLGSGNRVPACRYVAALACTIQKPVQIGRGREIRGTRKYILKILRFGARWIYAIVQT